MSKLKVLDLFSGIGGFSLGLERTGGFETVAFCEIEPFCRKVLSKHWPTVKQYEDVRTLTAERLKADGISVDVICGGFPCQDISEAGKRCGLSGQRSGLWSEIVRLSSEIRPQFIIVENVSNLLSLGMGDILGDLASIGFDAEWHSISATWLGAPHIRERIWIIANPNTKKNSFDTIIAIPGKTQANARAIGKRQWGTPMPPISRMVDGVPRGLDKRLGVLGNAVVPQIPELIGRAILEGMRQ